MRKKIAFIIPAVALTGCAANMNEFNKENDIGFGNSTTFVQAVFDISKKKSCLDFTTSENKNRHVPEGYSFECFDDEILIHSDEEDVNDDTKNTIYRLNVTPAQDSLYNRSITYVNGNALQELSKSEATFLTHRGYIFDPVFNKNYSELLALYKANYTSNEELEELVDMFATSATNYLPITGEQVEEIKRLAKSKVNSEGSYETGYTKTFSNVYNEETGEILSNEEFERIATKALYVGLKQAATEALGAHKFKFCDDVTEDLSICSVSGTPFKSSFRFGDDNLEVYNEGGSMFVDNLTRKYVEIKYAHTLFEGAHYSAKDTTNLSVIPPEAWIELPYNVPSVKTSVSGREQFIAYGISLLYHIDGEIISLNGKVAYNPIIEGEVKANASEIPNYSDSLPEGDKQAAEDRSFNRAYNDAISKFDFPIKP